MSRGHHTALPFEAVPDFVAELRKREAVTSLALEFTILTASCIGMVLGARWDEIDLSAKVWTVPGHRMKGGIPHRVPLTKRAVAILSEAAELRRGNLVVPSFRADRPMSDMAFSALLKRMKVKATTHGFRSSFRDWAGEETNHPREVAEAALSHVVGDETERAYRRVMLSPSAGLS